MNISFNAIITIVILLFFIIRTHGLAGYIQTIWAIPLFIIFTFSIYLIKKITKKSFKFLLIESIWILLSIFILIVNIIFNHGNFKLYETTNYLLFSIPFYLIGYYWGSNEKDLFFRRLIVSYFIFISLFLLSKIVQVKNFLIIDKETLGSLFFSPTGELNFNNLIFFWPFCSFVTIMGYIYLWDKSKGIIGNYLVLILTIICLISFILSGFAASISIIIFSFFLYYALKYGSKGRLWFLMSVPLFILLGFGTVNLLGSGIIGNFGAITAKANGIILLIESGKLFDEDILNIITSDRWTAGHYSILQFINKPLFGNGAYLDPIIGKLSRLENYTSAAGGHSFVLDTLAFYGIFGIPLILILVKFVRDAYKYYTISSENAKFIPRAYVAAIGSVLISNVLNSTFLFSNFDNFIFLCSGFFLGKFYILKYANQNQ